MVADTPGAWGDQRAAPRGGARRGKVALGSGARPLRRVTEIRDFHASVQGIERFSRIQQAALTMAFNDETWAGDPMLLPKVVGNAARAGERETLIIGVTPLPIGVASETKTGATQRRIDQGGAEIIQDFAGIR